MTPADVVSLAVYVFSALTFSTVTVYYWSQWWRRAKRGRSVLPVFTLACATAFLGNLFWRPAAYVSTALLPPLITHLVYEISSPRRFWRAILVGLYLGGLAGAAARFLSPGKFTILVAPAVMLAAAAAGGLAMLALSPPAKPGQRTHLRLISVLLALMLACAAASLSGWGAYADQLPDYLLLVFLCVTLYYRERLVFFDVLVKHGVFLALGLAISSVFLAAGFPWFYAAAPLAIWLGAPWVSAGVARAIDRLWLGRRLSPVSAERRFLQDIQPAAGEDDLRARATESLAGIFQAAAQVRFDALPPPADEDGLSFPLPRRLGSVFLARRPGGPPYLSDDRRLLQSLGDALAVVLENVRFREREQHLRWLAGRAELKALRAQINPHFLFNALSAIAGLIRSQPELADETIEKLAHVFRYTLRRSGSEWATLGEEVEFVAAYLRVEQARFGERLRVEFDIAPEAARAPIPAMSIQPLIENAVRHGVSAIEGSGIIRLRAAVDQGVLSVEVFDNGPGFPADFSLDGPAGGHGLRNIADRLRGYYPGHARLSWWNGPDGTHVTITIPGEDSLARSDRR